MAGPGHCPSLPSRQRQGGWRAGRGGRSWSQIVPKEKVLKMVLTCNFLREAGRRVCRGERAPRGSGVGGGAAPEASRQGSPRACPFSTCTSFSGPVIHLLRLLPGGRRSGPGCGFCVAASVAGRCPRETGQDCASAAHGCTPRANCVSSWDRFLVCAMGMRNCAPSRPWPLAQSLARREHRCAWRVTMKIPEGLAEQEVPTSARGLCGALGAQAWHGA